MASSSGTIGCLTGIAPWKRSRIAAMLADPNRPPHRSNAAKAVRLAKRNGGAVVCWATRIPSRLEQLAGDAGVPLWRIEDGFIRSVGLGAALVQPCSIVLDRRGIHYDPSHPSDLEAFLQHHDFTAAQCERAERLIARLKAEAITKYNLGGKAAELPAGRPIALVIGQVDDDESLRLGANGLRSADLLRRVRAEEAAACIVYRPHPDVSAGLRDGLEDGLSDGMADLVEADAPITQLIDAADRIHVLTSLAGFEALLRGRPVVTHGTPFYAGWGLTEDRLAFPRRSRRLTLAQLVYGALVAYPLYANPRTGKRCEVEELVEELAHSVDAAKAGLGRRLLGLAALGIARLQGTGKA